MRYREKRSIIVGYPQTQGDFVSSTKNPSTTSTTLCLSRKYSCLSTSRRANRPSTTSYCLSATPNNLPTTSIGLPTISNQLPATSSCLSTANCPTTAQPSSNHPYTVLRLQRSRSGNEGSALDAPVLKALALCNQIGRCGYGDTCSTK